KRLEYLRDALVDVQVAEAADERIALDAGRFDHRLRPRRMCHPPDRAGVAGFARAGLDVARVDDQTLGEVEHHARERKALWLRLPEERQQVVRDAERQQPSGDAEVALHRIEVPARVAAPERDPGE